MESRPACLLSYQSSLFSYNDIILNNFQIIVENLYQQWFDPDYFAQLYQTFFLSAVGNFKHKQIQCLYGFLQGKAAELQQLYPYERLIGNIANLINQQLYKTIVSLSTKEILLGQRNTQFLPNSKIIKEDIVNRLESLLKNIQNNELDAIINNFKQVISPEPASLLVIGNTPILKEILNQMPDDSAFYFAELAPDCFGCGMMERIEEYKDRFRTFLLADSAVAALMSSFDFVLVNCRHVYKGGACQLDPGALSIIEVANYFKKPVYVPAQSAYVCKDDVQSEFLCYKHGNVMPGGDYCDGALIDYYVMEQGIYSPGGVFKWVEENL